MRECLVSGRRDGLCALFLAHEGGTPITGNMHAPPRSPACCCLSAAQTFAVALFPVALLIQFSGASRPVFVQQAPGGGGVPPPPNEAITLPRAAAACSSQPWRPASTAAGDCVEEGAADATQGEAHPHPNPPPHLLHGGCGGLPVCEGPQGCVCSTAVARCRVPAAGCQLCRAPPSCRSRRWHTRPRCTSALGSLRSRRGRPFAWLPLTQLLTAPIIKHARCAPVGCRGGAQGGQGTGAGGAQRGHRQGRGAQQAAQQVREPRGQAAAVRKLRPLRGRRARAALAAQAARCGGLVRELRRLVLRAGFAPRSHDAWLRCRACEPRADPGSNQQARGMFVLAPHCAGKSFFKRKKQPVPVRLTGKDWAGQIRKACEATYLFWSGAHPQQAPR